MNQTLCVLFVVLAACASIGSALKCYECSSSDDFRTERCSDPFKPNSATRIKHCNPEAVCVKQGAPKMSFDDPDMPPIIARGCGFQSMCKNEPLEFQEFCHTCSTELCNSAATIIPSISTVIVLYIIKLMFL